MSAFLTYALNGIGVLAYIDDVANGAACNCYCPHCKAPLVAKNGVPNSSRQHHFAHANGQGCSEAYESSIHIMAKEVLQDTRYIRLPRNKDMNLPFGLVSLRHVEAEKYDHRYGIKPDVEGIMDNGERLLIEFNYSHKVDAKKRKVIVENRLKCVEIDLKYQAINKDTLREFLVNSDERRRWIVALSPIKLASENNSYTGRKEVFFKARDILKRVFDNDGFYIKPFAGFIGGYYDLRRLGYDVCEVGANYLGFKTDLLLYRSKQENKGFIAICLRGRNRSECDRPKNLRVIDIVLKTDLKADYILDHFKAGKFDESYAITFKYFGFNFVKTSIR